MSVVDKRVKKAKKPKKQKEGFVDKLKKLTKEQMIFGTVAIVCVIVIITALLLAPSFFQRGGMSTKGEERAVRTLLDSRTSYRDEGGTWVRHKDNRYDVFMPGKSNKPDGMHSVFCNVKYADDYDGALLSAFGLLEYDTKVNGAIEDNAQAVLDIVMQDLNDDVVKVSKGGNGSVGFDVGIDTSYFGKRSLHIIGEVALTLGYRDPKTEEVYTEDSHYSVEGYVYLVRSYPVVVWACYDPFDYFESEDTPRMLRECADTLWEPEYHKDDVVYVPLTPEEVEALQKENAENAENNDDVDSVKPTGDVEDSSENVEENIPESDDVTPENNVEEEGDK